MARPRPVEKLSKLTDMANINKEIKFIFNSIFSSFLNSKVSFKKRNKKIIPSNLSGLIKNIYVPTLLDKRGNIKWSNPTKVVNNKIFFLFKLRVPSERAKENVSILNANPIVNNSNKKITYLYILMVIFMIDNGYLFSKDDKRIFINTSMSCNGQCSYCYLPQLGYSNSDSNINTKSAEEIIKMIEQLPKLTQDTLITIGCFSECWNKYNKLETLKLISYFLKKGNKVQISNKKKINLNEIKEFLTLIKYYGQFIIFESIATISFHDYFEKNTDDVFERLETFKIKEVPIVLYIKPVLKNITIEDLEQYKKYILQYQIKDVVVGSLFTNIPSNESVPFSNQNELFYNPVDDEEIMLQELSKFCNTYKRSSNVANYYKSRNRRRDL